MKKAVSYPKSNVFNERQKQIFKYSDGSKIRGIDPLDVSIALSKQDFDWEQTALRAKVGDISAVSEMIEYSRKIFKLAEYEEIDGNSVGVTSQDVLNTLVDFVEYLDGVKKNIEETQILPVSMESQAI